MKKSTKTLQMPQFFRPSCMAYKKKQITSERERYVYVEDKYIKGDIVRLLSKVKNTFGLKKKIPLPRVAAFEKCTVQKKLPYAAYDTETHTVIANLTIDMNDDEEFLFIHELCHHVVLMMKDGKGRGFTYIQSNYLFGRMMDEGFTNFLAEQVYGKRVEIAYVFPTHVARQISNILGKKFVNNMYLSSDINAFKKDFNKKLENYYSSQKYRLKDEWNDAVSMTPFDVFCSCVEYVGVHWGNRSPKVENELISAMRSTIEMLDYYAILSNTTNMKSYLNEQRYFLNRHKRN